MNDAILMFGENAALIVTGCFVLIMAVLCALVFHDAAERRKKLIQMRAYDERHRQQQKNIREMDKTEFGRYCQQRQREMAAITAIERLKRP